MIYTNTCFNCGKVITGDKCPHCGYSFSLPFTCPRLVNGNGMLCIHTKKLCRNKNNFEQCDTFRSHN